MCVCSIGDKWTDLTIEKATGIVVSFLCVEFVNVLLCNFVSTKRDSLTC